MNVAVVGHVEWARFARVDHHPKLGEIVHATQTFDVPAGGGSVAAAQLRKLAGNCTFYTALADDELGHRAQRELAAMGVRVAACFRDERQREAFVHVDSGGERTITVMGPRLGPRGDDDLPWDELDGCDAVYFCAGDDAAFAHCRRAAVFVATTREAERIARVALPIDAAVGSATDPSEVYVPTDPPPGLVVETQGQRGGRYRTADGKRGRYAAGTVPGDVVCTYGAGDSFVAALAYALGAGMPPRDALRLASDCGAAVLSGAGPYVTQLGAADVARR